jgi:hypothetical protein
MTSLAAPQGRPATYADIEALPASIKGALGPIWLLER